MKESIQLQNIKGTKILILISMYHRENRRPEKADRLNE